LEHTFQNVAERLVVFGERERARPLQMTPGNRTRSTLSKLPLEDLQVSHKYQKRRRFSIIRREVYRISRI
jgi:hypothetical protein